MINTLNVLRQIYKICVVVNIHSIYFNEKENKEQQSTEDRNGRIYVCMTCREKNQHVMS